MKSENEIITELDKYNKTIKQNEKILVDILNSEIDFNNEFEVAEKQQIVSNLGLENSHFNSMKIALMWVLGDPIEEENELKKLELPGIMDFGYKFEEIRKNNPEMTDNEIIEHIKRYGDLPPEQTKIKNRIE